MHGGWLSRLNSMSQTRHGRRPNRNPSRLLVGSNVKTTSTTEEFIAKEPDVARHERSSTGKSARRAATRAAQRANSRAARRRQQQGKVRREPTSTHRLVGAHHLDDSAWERRKQRGLRAAFVAERDRATIAQALEVPSRHVGKFVLA